MNAQEQIKMLKEQRAVLRASNEKFRKEFINKACEWLSCHARLYGYADAPLGDAEYYFNEKKLVDAFRKAMENKI